MVPERDRDEVRYLRSTAARFRNLASSYSDSLGADMLKIAEDLEQRAAEVEARIPKGS